MATRRVGCRRSCAKRTGRAKRKPAYAAAPSGVHGRALARRSGGCDRGNRTCPRHTRATQSKKKMAYKPAPCPRQCPVPPGPGWRLRQGRQRHSCARTSSRTSRSFGLTGRSRAELAGPVPSQIPGEWVMERG
eukprot:gene20516-biopygen7062